MYFKSDNIHKMSQFIMDAIIESNNGVQEPYGCDDYSKKLKEKFKEVFEHDISFFLTSTGTAANCLTLSAITKPYEFIACHTSSHLNTDECGAPAFFTGGSSLLLIDGPNGKIDPNILEEKIKFAISARPRGQKVGSISITQATEMGTVYTVSEIKQISEVARKYSIPVHMDGARFANAVAGSSPSEVTWKAGIDVMSFGGTKNGCMNAEAVIFFKSDLAKDFDYLQKRSGQLMSKTRFVSAQFLAYLENDLWIKNAKIANNQAKILSDVFKKHQIEIKYPVDANEVFVIMSYKTVQLLYSKGFGFYQFGDGNLYRFVTSCFTTDSDIELLDNCLSDA